MTALKPLEDLRVRGVASRRYPLNKKCAHPECSEAAVDPHHAFPRSQIGNDSWFVLLGGGDVTPTSDERGGGFRQAIPHVTGLCRMHHDAVELHAAWIKLEEGEWRWYDESAAWSVDEGVQRWTLVGPLNPQPGSVEGRAKRKKFKGEARRNRTTISIKVPKDDQEDGGALFDEAIEALRERYNPESNLPVYNVIMLALHYTILNTTADDFQGGIGT